MLIPAILVSIVALLAAMDEQLFGASMMARPLFTGPIIGLIMGDLQTGVIIGATLESMFMGSIMVGSAVPPEVYASSILSIAIAIQTGAGAGTAGGRRRTGRGKPGAGGSARWPSSSPPPRAHRRRPSQRCGAAPPGRQSARPAPRRRRR